MGHALQTGMDKGLRGSTPILQGSCKVMVYGVPQVDLNVILVTI